MDPGYLIARAARWWPEETAIRVDDTIRTYGTLDERARRLAASFRSVGLNDGDRVAILSGNRIEYLEVDLAIAYGGLVRVALNARLSLDDFSYAVEDSGARVLVSDPHYDEVAVDLVDRHDMFWWRMGEGSEAVDARSVEAAIEVTSPGSRHRPSPEDPAWISYTSGTTGRPKGVVLSHHALSHVAFNMMLGLSSGGPGSSVLLPQPLSHGAGFFGMTYLASGGTVHVMPEFDPEHIYALGNRNHIDTLKIVPVMLSDMLETSGESSFETIVYGAAPISESRVAEAIDRYGPVLVQIYGQSEAPVTITRLSKLDHAVPGDHRRSAGRPWHSVAVDILSDDGSLSPPGEIGEVVVAGEHLMTGYHGQREQTDDVLRDGRVWTRDMAFVDERGYIHLRGRRDEMINSGGYNIAPKEVQEVIDRHEAVEESVVIGIPHERWGETVRAYVRLRPGRSLDGAALSEFARRSLGFRRPTSVVVVVDIPRTAYGKVDRQALLAETPTHEWNG